MKKIIKTYLCIFFIIPIAIGCAQKISVDEYYKKRENIYRPMDSVTGEVYYCGSNKKYDFIFFRPGFGFRDLTKLKKGDLELDRFNYTKDRSKWVTIFPKFETDTTIFKEEKYKTTPVEVELFKLK